MNITVAKFLLKNNVYKDRGTVRIPTIYYDQIMDALNEQGAVEPDTDSEGTCSCGNCGETVGYYPVGSHVPEKLCMFCPKCGKEVKWTLR